MVFVYRNFTVSGTRPDTEGTSKFIQEAKSFLEAAGWTTVDDRTAQPGADHKLVMSSQGEESTYPTFYMILTSGLGTATAGQSDTSFQVATDWNVGSHSVPADGVVSPIAVGNPSYVSTYSQQDWEVWMSGDSEGVVFVTRQSATYDSIAAGRLNQFSSVEEDPYPLYINGSISALITVENATYLRGIAGNPPQALGANSEAEIKTFAFASTNQPYQLGSVTSIYLAAPLVLYWDDLSPIRKGLVGTLRNAWAGAGSNAGMLEEGTLVASGTFGKQVYRAFLSGTTDSLIIRQE